MPELIKPGDFAPQPRFIASASPPTDLPCSAAGAVPVLDVERGLLVLVYNPKTETNGRPPRYELPSGKSKLLDPSQPIGRMETCWQTTERELLEEAGFVAWLRGFFGFRRYANPPPSPFPPRSYLGYSWALTDQDLVVPTDPAHARLVSIKQRIFSVVEMERLVAAGQMQPEEFYIAVAGLAALRRALHMGLV